MLSVEFDAYNHLWIFWFRKNFVLYHQITLNNLLISTSCLLTFSISIYCWSKQKTNPFNSYTYSMDKYWTEWNEIKIVIYLLKWNPKTFFGQLETLAKHFITTNDKNKNKAKHKTMFSFNMRRRISNT